MSIAGDGVAEQVVRRQLSGKRADVSGRLFEIGLLLTLLISLLLLLALLIEVFGTGWGVIQDRGADFVTSNLSSIPSRAGVHQSIIGSLMLMAFVVILAFPLGIASAIYIEEYAPDNRLTRIINANIRNLAGVPSIVYGILGVVVFVQILQPLTGGRSVISGGVTMAILVLPIVIITTAEALRSVPQSIREAGFGVGATRWEVVRSHVLPYAAPGILTGTILSLGRALGETAPLLLIGSVTGFLSTGSGGLIEQLQGPYTSLPTTIFSWARRSETAFGNSTAAAIIVLLVVLLVMNATAIILRGRYEQKW